MEVIILAWQFLYRLSKIINIQPLVQYFIWSWNSLRSSLGVICYLLSLTEASCADLASFGRRGHCIKQQKEPVHLFFFSAKKSALSPPHSFLSRKTKIVQSSIYFKSQQSACCPCFCSIICSWFTPKFHLFKFNYMVPFLKVFHVDLQYSHLCGGGGGGDSNVYRYVRVGEFVHACVSMCGWV